MNNQDIPHPVLQQQVRRKRGKASTITFAIILSLFLCGALCVGAPMWLVYQWNRGTYYGYITVDDPTMTYTQNVSDIVNFGSVQFQVSSMQFVKDRDTTFLVVHVRIKQGTTSSIPNSSGRLVVYTSPVFNAPSGSNHAFTGNEIDPVAANAPVPVPYVSSRISYDESSGFNSTSEEGDILYKMPSQNISFVLVLIPPQSYKQYAWNSKIDDCQFVPFHLC